MYKHPHQHHTSYWHIPFLVQVRVSLLYPLLYRVCEFYQIINSFLWSDIIDLFLEDVEGRAPRLRCGQYI